MTAQQGEREVHEVAVWFSRRANPDDCYRAFEAYGHAMAAASAFEMLMALMIMKALALRLDKRANANIQPADRPGLIRSLMDGSYDRLQRQLCLSFTLSDELRTGLADGKGARDHLAHNFWPGHVDNLHSSEGVDIIATDCATHANHFRLLTTAVLEETGLGVDEYLDMILNAPDRGEKFEGWQQVLRAEGLN